MRRHRQWLHVLWPIVLLGMIVGSAWLAAWVAERAALRLLANRADAQLELRALALQRLIDRYRVLPTVMALDPELRAALAAPAAPIGDAALNRKLERANGATHVSTLTLIDRHGRAIAADNWREPTSNVGLDYAFRPYFQQAMRQDQGSFYAVGVSTGVAGYFIANALHDDAGQRIGVIVVKITLDSLRREWAQSEDALLLSDEHDVVFLANRPGWQYRPLHPLEPTVERALASSRQYGAQPAAPIRRHAEADGLLRLDDPRVADPVLWRAYALPAQRWTLHLLADSRPARVAARNAALVTAGAWLPLILLGLFLQQRWRLARLRQRSREELERMVTHYTGALRSAQDGLVQAAHQAAQGHNSLEHLPQGVSVVDAQLRLVAWNSRYAEIFDFPPELLQVGQPIEDLFRHNARRGLLGTGNSEESIQRRLDYLRQGGPHMYERERADGSVLEIRGNPLPDGGFVTSYADITAYKAAARDLRTLASTLERRIEESTRDLRAAKAEAERANRYKTRYVAAAVHDLLQPLNAARLFAGALRQRLDGTAERELLTRVEHALQAQDSLLASMLDIARLEAGVLQPRLQHFALSPLLQELARQFGIMAQARDLRLDFVDSDSWVRSDSTLLRRVLQNFLSNAIHYTPRGRVLLGCRRVGERIRIEVWDTGVGIAEGKRETIFQAFQRLDSGVDGDERNAGLGLAIVERIARLLEHPLRLRSWPGHGSVFAIELPRVAAEATLPAAPSRLIDESDSPLRGQRVLCLDDDAPVREGLLALLRGWGCVGRGLESAAAALADATPSSAPDLLLLDYQLGESRGPELLPELYRRWGCAPPVVVLSALPDPDLRDTLASAGLRFLAKPVSPSRLRALLSQLLIAAKSDE